MPNKDVNRSKLSELEQRVERVAQLNRNVRGICDAVDGIGNNLFGILPVGSQETVGTESVNGALQELDQQLNLLECTITECKSHVERIENL